MTNLELAADYIDERTLAEQIGRARGRPVTTQTLRLWRRQGYGPPAIKIGRQVLYRIAGVDEWLRKLEAGK
jgi:hypothetical protein